MTQRRRSIFSAIAIAIAIAIALALPAAPGAASAEPASVDQIVLSSGHDFMRTHPRTVGLSLGIAEHGRVHTYNFGVLSRGANAQATADTPYPIASITKTFTATLVAQAALDGKLALTDDPRKYLDGAYPNLSYAGHPMRIFDLLDHRSGLPYFLPDVPAAQPDYQNNAVPFLTRIAALRRGYGTQDFLRDLHSVKLLGEPGAEPPHYSNPGVELAGLILTRVYATPYSNLLRARIFAPLGMTSTCTDAACAPGAAQPAGYDSRNHRLPDDVSALGPAGDIRSSVNDMLQYIVWQHDPGNKAAQLSRVPRATIGDYSAGLNWQTWTANDRHLVWQSGNVPGFGSLCVDEVEPNIQLVILMNGTDDATDDGKETLANTILQKLNPRSVPLP